MSLKASIGWLVGNEGILGRTQEPSVPQNNHTFQQTTAKVWLSPEDKEQTVGSEAQAPVWGLEYLCEFEIIKKQLQLSLTKTEDPWHERLRGESSASAEHGDKGTRPLLSDVSNSNVRQLQPWESKGQCNPHDNSS